MALYRWRRPGRSAPNPVIGSTSRIELPLAPSTRITLSAAAVTVDTSASITETRRTLLSPASADQAAASHSMSSLTVASNGLLDTGRSSVTCQHCTLSRCSLSTWAGWLGTKDNQPPGGCLAAGVERVGEPLPYSISQGEVVCRCPLPLIASRRRQTGHQKEKKPPPGLLVNKQTGRGEGASAVVSWGYVP